MALYKELIMAMLRTGILGFGGGPSVIPLIRYEAVTRYHWLDDEEFGETWAVANALPGPIAPKMAAYLGYRGKGAMGAIVAVLAHISPTCIATVVLLSLVSEFQFSKSFTDMINAIMPVIAVMLGQMAYEFAFKALKGLGKILGVLFLVLSFILLYVLPIHPAIVILIFLIYGAFHYRIKARVRQTSK
ncbi:chromate transporter [Neobacillus sp. PS3-12]|jgi:chromate transporter|uniref:chromate transporter n=1 Tax=Neobacillus sp. PS3-12 TaxID=3070677 RepID=UPI0027E070D4|nr:chromate transporter [Neobacillus sp. PS3-12]WML51273.1 chromate transporter [Neobacillus sp. PS3-12]